MATTSSPVSNAPVQEPELSIILNGLRNEINRYRELSQQLYSRINQLKFIPETKGGECEPDRIDKDCMNSLHTEIKKLRETNNSTEQVINHLYTVVGS